MSVVNTMLRDLEARGSDQRRQRIPVKKSSAQVAGSRHVFVGGLMLVITAVAGWQWWVSSDGFVPSNKNVAQQPAAAVQTAAVPQQSAPVVVANTAVAVEAPVQSQVQPQLKVEPVRTTWQWSKDGFALQLDQARDVRYGVERVDAGTLKVSLAHAALQTLDIPGPTPRWIETLRVQRDEQQQSITVHSDSRLEYDIAALADNSLVLSVWRNMEEVPATADATDVAGVAAKPEVAARAEAEEPVTDNTAIEPPTRAHTEVRSHYSAPRIEPTALTAAQRDARLAAEAATEVRAGNTARAIDTLRKAQETTSAMPKSSALLVTLLLSSQRQTEAAPFLDRALQVSPNDTALLKLKARTLAMRGELEQARAVLATLAPTTSRDTELLALCASLAQQAHDFDAAATHYLQWTRIEPASGAAWYGLALALDAQASPRDAITAYRQALGLISDARLRDYANTRIRSLAALSSTERSSGKPSTGKPRNTDVARSNRPDTGDAR